MFFKKAAFWLLASFLMLSCTQQPNKNLVQAQKDQQVQGAFAWLAPVIGMLALSACGKKAATGGGAGSSDSATTSNLPALISAESALIK